jgi:hypothetical protein
MDPPSSSGRKHKERQRRNLRISAPPTGCAAEQRENTATYAKNLVRAGIRARTFGDNPPLLAGSGLASFAGMTRLALIALLGFAATASAQTPPGAVNPWTPCTTLEVFGGSATSTPSTTGTFGAALGWELTHHAEIQGLAAWLAARDGAEAFAADLKLFVNLTRPSWIVPYIGGGAGLFHAAFDTAQAMPDFYQRRVASRTLTGRTTFTDPSAVIAAGAHFYVARHLSVRPEVNLRLVVDDARTYRVTSVTFAVAYHAEEHARETVR